MVAYTRVPNWTEAEFPQPPWDTPGLPPRRMDERCALHKHCAFRDDDPARCGVCQCPAGEMLMREGV